MMEAYEQILKRKIEYYGKTEAAYEFAAEELATQSRIEENITILRYAEKIGNGGLEFKMHSRIQELENMIRALDEIDCRNSIPLTKT